MKDVKLVLKTVTMELWVPEGTTHYQISEVDDKIIFFKKVKEKWYGHFYERWMKCTKASASNCKEITKKVYVSIDNGDGDVLGVYCKKDVALAFSKSLAPSYSVRVEETELN
jgi:hypothetical protein